MDLLLQLPDVRRLGHRPRQCFRQTMPVLSKLLESETLRLRPMRGNDARFRLSNAAKAPHGAQLGNAAAGLSRLPPISRLDSETTFLSRPAGQFGDGST